MLDESQISDAISSKITSGLIAQSLALGMLVGPPVAGLIAQLTNTREFFEYFGALLLISCPIYYVFARNTTSHATYKAIPELV